MKDQFVFVKKLKLPWGDKLLFAFSDSEENIRLVYEEEARLLKPGESAFAIKAQHNTVLNAFDFPPSPETVIKSRVVPSEPG
ncbi:MAG: hypothetical protein PHV97_00635 [Candidatus Omnitrophica bacterium]|nr:hypothetical protein [Candidatus Omnitrophota bacterium]